MRVIRVESKVMENLKVNEHNNVSKITIFMPVTGITSQNQTDIFFTKQNLNLDSNFMSIKTINKRDLVINTNHVILVERGRLIELQNGFVFFIRENQEYEIKDKENYGYSSPDTTF
jgi:hypothetical protein